MEKPRLEVVVLSDEGPVCPKRLLPALEEDQPASKRLRMNSLVCPMEWEPSLPPHRGRYAYDDGFVASSLACPPVQVQPLSTQLQKKPPRRARYDPNDFTSDELNPAFEWPKESPSARKYGAEVSLLQSIVGQFPLGLRLDKLVTLMWKEHRVHLWRLSAERGYGDILQFLEGVPGVRLSLSKGGSRYLVHMA
ncbi:UNVERIFIED_CONTAM: hypothetical protein K2H54_037852 [Gekko kuhli]